MSDKTGEKAVKPTVDTSSESSPSGSTDEVAETRDDLEQLNLAKTQEESEQSKDTRKEETGSPIRKTSSTEEPPESKPGTSRQQMHETPGDDSHSESKDILPESSGIQKPVSRDISEESSERDLQGAKIDQKSIDYGKMPYRDVVGYFLRDESVSREMTPSGEGNTLSDVSEICTQATSGSSMEGSVYRDAQSSVKSEPSVYHDAPSSIKSESSVYHDASSSVKSESFHDALESQNADISDSTNLSELPSLSSNASSDLTISTPTGEQGHAAYIAMLEREVRERGDPTSTSSGFGSTNLSELDNMVDWVEEGELLRIPRPRRPRDDIVRNRDDGENLERDSSQVDRSSSGSTSEDLGHAAYLAELEKEAREFKVESSSSDTSSSDLANVQNWLSVGKRIATESSGSSLDHVGGDVEPMKSEKCLPVSSRQVSDSKSSTLSTERVAAHSTKSDQEHGDSSESTSSSENESGERMEMATVKKWLIRRRTRSQHVPSKLAKEVEYKHAHEFRAEKETECSIKDEISDSRLSIDSDSSVEPMSTTTSDISHGLGSSTETTEPEGAMKLQSTVQTTLDARHKLQYATVVRIETIEEENLIPIGIEPAANVEPKFKSAMSPEQMEVSSPSSKAMEHDSPETTQLHEMESPSLERLKTKLASEESRTIISEAGIKTGHSISSVSTETLEFRRDIKCSTEPMELDEAAKFLETKKLWQRSGSLRKLRHTTVSSTESSEEALLGAQKDAEGTKSEESKMLPEEMEVGSPVEHEILCESTRKDVGSSRPQPKETLTKRDVDIEDFHMNLSEASSIKDEILEFKLSKDSSSSIEPTSIETSEFSRSVESSIESMEPEDSKFKEFLISDAGYQQILQYATMACIETIEDEEITPLVIEESLADEPTTCKDPVVSPEQMEVSSPSPKAMEQECPEMAQLHETETMQSTSEHDLEEKPKSKESHTTISEFSDMEERTDSRLSSCSLEHVSSSTSEFSLGSSTESTEPEGSSVSRSARKSSPKPSHQHKVQYATLVHIETIEEEVVTPFGIELGTCTEQTMVKDAMPRELTETPVEQECVSEKTKDPANKNVTEEDTVSKMLTPAVTSSTPIPSETEGSSVVEPIVKSEKQLSRLDTKQDKITSASCDSKSQIGKRSRKKAKLDKDKKVKHAKSPKKRARRLSSGSHSESTGEFSGSGTNSESDYSAGN